MFKKILKALDYSIIIFSFVLFIIGIIALYSANGGVNGDTSETMKQVVWMIVGVVTMIAIIFIDYDVFGKLWVPLYVLTIIALIAVLFTEPINGATSWFNIGPISIQPSEFGKIVLILGLGKVIENFKKKNIINKPLVILTILAFVAVPILLVIKQPDYGTAMVLIVITAAMLYTGGINYKYIVGAVIITAIAIPVAYNYVLPAHAKSRIDVFLNPQSDPQGAGYNIIQAELAVGSGQLFGMGLLEGNQTQLGYLPMKVTDFIYAVISEEMGFIVSTLVVVLFVLLIIRGFYIAKMTSDLYGMLIATGISTMYLAHFIENVGMNIGLMPITGIPLPFISYGGSAMLTNFIGLGLLLSVNGHRTRKMFE